MSPANDEPPKVTILFASQTGTAIDYASTLFRIARRNHHEATFRSVADFDVLDLLEIELCIFVVSTAGQGEVPTSMKSFWNILLRQDLDDEFLEDMDFAILGLGDSKYPKYNFTAKKLRRRLEQLGSREVLDIGLCDEQHGDGLDGIAEPWIASFEQLLRKRSGKVSISDDVLLEPVHKLVKIVKTKPIKSVQDVSRAEHLTVKHRNSPREASKEELAGNRGCTETNGSTALTEAPMRNGVYATLTKNQRLTPDTHFQDIRLLRLKLETPQKLAPGDICVLYPTNQDEVVAEFLSKLKLEDEADMELNVQSSCALPSLPSPITLRSLAKYVFPLTSTPPRSLFSQLRHFTDNQDFKDKFRDWDTKEGRDDFYDYLTRPRRTLMEVLADFEVGLHVPLEHCLDLFGTMFPREYSVAGVQSSGEIELIVALVKYQTKIRRPREGVASSWIAALPESTRLEIVLRKGSMPVPQDSPVLCVGPGTGLAPLRFLTQCIPNPSQDANLIFGCRSKDDQIFTSEFTAAELEGEGKDQGMDQSDGKKGLAQYHVAFSRIEREEYVQTLLVREKALVKQILVDKAGFFYLSGSSGKMPEAVREAIVECIGEEEVDRLFVEGRWWEETW